MNETPFLVSIIIVSFNTCQMTIECIESVYRFAGSDHFDVIVVDNASSDGSADAIAHAYPAVRLIRSKINLGFGKANNLAANETTGKYILLLNPDTLILDNAIQRLVKFADDNPVAAGDGHFRLAHAEGVYAVFDDTLGADEGIAHLAGVAGRWFRLEGQIGAAAQVEAKAHGLSLPIADLQPAALWPEVSGQVAARIAGKDGDDREGR